MKSFKQFLKESYLSEEPAGRERSPKEQAEWDKINKKEAEKAAKKAQRKPSGAAADPSKQFKPQAKTTKVASPARKSSGAAADPWKQFPKKPQQQLGMPKTGPSSTLPGRTLAPTGGTTAKPALPAAGQTQKGGALATTSKGGAPATNPPIQAVKVSDVTKPKGKLPSGTKGGTLATRPVSTTAKTPPINAVNVRDITPKHPNFLPVPLLPLKKQKKRPLKQQQKLQEKVFLGVLENLSDLPPLLLMLLTKNQKDLDG